MISLNLQKPVIRALVFFKKCVLLAIYCEGKLNIVSEKQKSLKKAASYFVTYAEQILARGKVYPPDQAGTRPTNKG